MNSWQHASETEKMQFEAISTFLIHRPELISFLFDTGEAKLDSGPDKIISRSRGLCYSDQVLVRLAMDLWCDHGQISVHELFSLDFNIFESALSAIKMLGPKPSRLYEVLMAVSHTSEP
jgi:hypothetical protein